MPLALVLAVGLAACSEDPPGDSLETSDQAVSVSPSSVYPTPASSPSPGASGGAIARWCEELAEAGGDEERAIEIYREGAGLPDPTLATAAKVLVSGMPADEALAAGREIQSACEERGIDITD